MEHRASNYAVKPTAPTSTHASKTRTIIGITIGIFLICAIAVGLGVGLGLGLKKTDPPPSSNASTCDAATAQCGCASVQPTISSRIVNGSIATANSWPWMVAIFFNNGNGRFCGGTLISYQHVLTAAHCVFDVTSNDVTVYAGIQKLSERTNGQVRNVSTIYVHPNYSDSTKVNDMAILKLSSPLSASTIIGLCCLSTMSSVPAVGDSPVYIGWGRTEPTSGFSDDLRQSNPKVVNSSFCSYASITDNQICTGNTTSIACYGDSGSPLMMKINNAWTCVGVVNMGLMTCDSYVVFTRVSSYNSFISNVTSM